MDDSTPPSKKNPAPLSEPEESDSVDGSLRRDFLIKASLSTAGLMIACGDDDLPLLDASTLPDGGGPDGMGGPDSGNDAGNDAGVDAGTDAGPGDAGTDVPLVGGPEAIPENAAGFAMGVSAGDASETSAVLWTNYSGSAPLRLGVWEWDGSSYGKRVVDEAAIIGDGGFVHVGVAALVAGARYRYSFVEMDGAVEATRSRIGTFRAAIASDSLEVVRFGAVSCTRNDYGAFASLRSAAARTDLDAFLLLGDTTYNDGAGSLAQFRAKWRENLSTDEYRDLFASVGLYATWDDHEVTNNWNGESVAPAMLDAARTAFWEHLPLRREEEDSNRIWRSQKWGNTVEVFVLDCRSERAPSRDEYISRAQMDWLKTGLSESTARFKVIMNSVGITRFPFNVANNDRWQGFAAQRVEILEHIDAGITGVLWVAGDFHFTCLGHVGRTPTSLGWDQFEVLVGPAGNTSNPAYLICRPPQFPMASGTRNYTELTFEPEAGEITIRWVGEDGAVFSTQTVEA